MQGEFSVIHSPAKKQVLVSLHKVSSLQQDKQNASQETDRPSGLSLLR